MKKIFMVLALMAMLMLPLTSFSMTAMEEGDLSSVTGQAGVSINLDARVDLAAETVAWGDLDGFTAPNVSVTSGEDAAGWVGLSALSVQNLRVRTDQTLLEAEWFQKHSNIALATAFQTGATTLATNYAIATGDATPTVAEAITYAVGQYATASGDVTPTVAEAYAYETANPGTVLGGFTTFVGAQSAITALATGGNAAAAAFLTVANEKASGTFTPFAPLTIDVATGTAAVPFYGEGTTFVRIGLGSLQVAMDSMDANVELGPDAGYVGDGSGLATGVPNLKYQLGSLYLGDLYLRIGGNSYVDIFNDRGAGTQGVSIVTNVILKEFSVGVLSWGDADGVDWAFSVDAESVLGTHTVDSNLVTPDAADPIADAAGFVGLKDLNIDWLSISGRIDIDVATAQDPVLLTDWTFVQIGLDALTVNMSGLTTTAALGAAKDTLDQELGELYISSAVITVNGDLQIGARADGTQGVTIDLNQLSVDISQGLTVSWGDLDGIGGTSAAGYVGLIGLNIADLELQGKVTIDVATIRDFDPDTATTIQDMMYLGYRENNLSPTIVHIGLGSGDATADTYNEVLGVFLGDALGVSISSLSGGVAFAPVNNLIGANTIGNIYLGGVKVGINGWVDIAAH